MPERKPISEERARRIARSHACPTCQEYSFKKIVVKRAPTSHAKDLKTYWAIVRVCGVCGLDQEMGLDAEGELVYAG
jgi:transcription elongation factor Elf1